MACTAPMKGYASRSGQWCKNATWPGARSLTVPCGQCIGCGLDHIQDWVVRNLHELESHDDACFVTATYSDENLPHVARFRDGELELWPTLDKRDLQLFWKRLRKRLDVPVRYFACGEYGDQLGRPHYHFILYGWSFPDRQLAPDQGGSLEPLYVSELLSEVWPHGYCTIGDVTPKSIEYVARYTLKKRTKKERDRERDPRVPIFATMSRGGRVGGIGKRWIQRWAHDVYPSDSVVIDGQERRPPRFYDEVVAKERPDLVASMKEKRRSRAELRERNGHFSHQVLSAKESILRGQQKFKRRTRCG